VTFKIEVLPSAADELASLPREIQRRLARKIDALADRPQPQGVGMLQGKEKLLRLRVGDYRVIYRLLSERRTIVIVKFGHRGDVSRRH